MIIAAVLMVIAWFIAANEALDLEWVPTIVTVVIGWIILIVITAVIGGLVLGAFGMGAAVVGGIFGS